MFDFIRFKIGFEHDHIHGIDCLWILSQSRQEPKCPHGESVTLTSSSLHRRPIPHGIRYSLTHGANMPLLGSTTSLGIVGMDVEKW